MGINTVEFHTGSYANAFIKNINIDKEFKKIEENVFFAKEKSVFMFFGGGSTTLPAKKARFCLLGIVRGQIPDGHFWRRQGLTVRPWPGSCQSLPTLGGRDSVRPGLSVRTWLAESAKAADLKDGFGGEAPQGRETTSFGCLNFGEYSNLY